MTQTPDRPGINELTSDMLDQLYQRAKQAEATLTAVRELAQRMHDWDGDRPAVGKWIDELRTVLAQHGQTPA